MKKYLPGVFASLGIVLTASLFVFSGKNVIAAPATHIVVSQVSTGGSSTNEFVELYNPLETDVAMESWKLTRKNSGGSEANLVATLDGTIPARGYFLIGHGTGYTGSVTLDVPYSAASNALTNNYTVLLYDGADIVVDKVGFGTALDFETSAFGTSPAAGQSIERKPCGEDTDNNLNDFVLREVSNPRNSQSETDEQSCSTQTPTPTATPTTIPTSSPSATATSTPTLSPSPSPTPTVLPTVAPSKTPKATFNPMLLSCGMEFKLFNFGFFYLRLPLWKCS